MSRTVIVLGAGASREAGGPLMNDFIKMADDLNRQGRAGWAQESFDLVFHARELLQRAWVKGRIDLDNIEHLFAAFEMSELLGRLADLEPSKVCRLVDAMRNVITRTLEDAIRWPTVDGKPLYPPAPYDAFAEVVSLLHNSPLYGPVSLVTFNYDLALDHALLYHGFDTDYCLSPGPAAPRTNLIPLMKLHGSLNWDAEPGTVKVLPISSHNIPRRSGRPSGQLGSVPLSQLLGDSRLFPQDRPYVPEIIPPTWNKGKHHSRLLNVWQRAANSLHDAENIIIAGYSLPETDQFFRHFYALSTISDTILQRFWVIDPSSNIQTFRKIVGEVITQRNCFRHIQNTFGDSLEIVLDLLGLPLAHVRALQARHRALTNGNYATQAAALETQLAAWPRGT